VSVGVPSDFLRLGGPLFCASESEELQDAKRLADTSTGRTFAASIDKLHPVASSASLHSNTDAVSSSSFDLLAAGTTGLKPTSGGGDVVTAISPKPSGSSASLNGQSALHIIST